MSFVIYTNNMTYRQWLGWLPVSWTPKEIRAGKPCPSPSQITSFHLLTQVLTLRNTTSLWSGQSCSILGVQILFSCFRRAHFLKREEIRAENNEEDLGDTSTLITENMHHFRFFCEILGISKNKPSWQALLGGGGGERNNVANSDR